MVQPFLDPYPWASESLSLKWVKKKKKKLCYYNNASADSRLSRTPREGGQTINYGPLGIHHGTFNANSAKNPSFRSIFIYGFNLGLIRYLDFREMSPLPRGYMCKQQKFRIRGTKGLNRVLGVQIRGRRKEENLFSPKPGASLRRSDHWRERKNSV